MYTIILTVFLVSLVFTFWWVFPKRPSRSAPIPERHRQILFEQVPFYRNLTWENKMHFEERMQFFLAQTKITGVNTIVEDIDRVLIGAGAIIPVFHFKNWVYGNLNEVLLYPDTFDHDYTQLGPGRNILGMVGDGPMNYVMILSKPGLRSSFWEESGNSNTAIHEFIHLVDKTDGSLDGIPSALLDKKYVLPWLQLMHWEINNIREMRSEINPYAATNQVEFFAVVSEYYFKNPEQLKLHHPELHALLQQAFVPGIDSVYGLSDNVGNQLT